MIAIFITLYLIIGLVIGILLYKYDFRFDFLELGISGNTILWPTTLIVALCLGFVFCLITLANWIEEKLEDIVDKIFK